METFRVTFAPTVRTQGVVEEIEARDCGRDSDWIVFRGVADIHAGPPIIRLRVEDAAKVERLSGTRARRSATSAFLYTGVISRAFPLLERWKSAKV